MFIEQPPLIYRLMFPGSLWRKKRASGKTVYLTFDDGPIPEITPWVLDILDKYDVKATFFCVGENVVMNPEIYQMILDRGHQVGNHTFNHLQGLKTPSKEYEKNVLLASTYIKSKLFRPPHGHFRLSQFLRLRKKFQIVLWDVVTRDYSKLMTPEKVVENVKRYTRNGSVIVFHDSLKAEKNMKAALPKAIEWLKSEGYSFGLLQPSNLYIEKEGTISITQESKIVG